LTTPLQIHYTISLQSTPHFDSISGQWDCISKSGYNYPNSPTVTETSLAVYFYLSGMSRA
jgi:hypothetical protein